MKRIPDLSVRPPTNGGRNPNPNFRDQKRYVNTVTSTGAKVLEIFAPNSALTVQWIILQVSTAITLQPYLSGQPFGAALVLGAGAIIQYPGTILAPNERLQFSVSGATSLSFEVVYVNAIRPDLIETDLTIISVGNVIAQIEDTSGNTLNSDGAGDLRVNPYGPTGSFKSSVKTVAGNLQNTITVPAGKKWILKASIIIPTTNATAGTRTPSLYVTDVAANVLSNINAAIGMGATLTVYYTFGPSLPLSTVLTSSTATCPVPEFVLGPGATVNGSLNGGLAGDSFKLNLTVIELPD